MSLADEFLSDAGVSGKTGSLADAFVADAQGASPADLPRKKLQPPEPLSTMDRLLAKVPHGVVNNPGVAGARNFVTAAAAPTVGLAQLLANAMPDSTGVPQTYNQKIAGMLRKDAEATKEGGTFSETNKLAGGMASPINLVLGASQAAPAITAGQRAIQGAGIGAAGGATAPVDVTEGGTSDSGKFWGKKAVQTGVGALGGAVMAPVIGAVGDRLVSGLNTKNFNPATAAKNADQLIESALKESGQKLDDLPMPQADALRKQVVESLRGGKNLDVAAALRKGDFDAEGIQPTLGWVTRDPRQWEAEQNVRGVKGAGEKVGRVISSGNRALVDKIGSYANNAAEPAAASQGLADALRKYDQGRASDVSNMYSTARASAGKDLEVPTEGLQSAYQQAYKDFKDNIPTAVRDQFEALGKTPFTFESADQLRKTINANVGDKPSTTRALGILRSALDNAQKDAAVTGGPYAPAVKMASQRFAEREAIPGIATAADGEANDRFVRQQVINNPSTSQVQKLAALLRAKAPDQFEQTRQQIGSHLAEAAFGANAAGDKQISQERYNKALRNLGTGKLEAFFEPQEVEQMKRLGRLGAYQVAPPAGAASNYSNTASALANLLRSAGGFLPVGKGSVQFMGDKIEANAALNPKVPVTPNLSPEQRRMMSRALLALTGGAAATGPGVVGQ